MADAPLDRSDRKLLGALVANAQETYAALGKIAGLSAPAAHDRVKRLRRRGIVKGVSARLDGAALGKPFLAFVHIDIEGWGKSARLLELETYPEVEELHSVTGDTGLILKVRTANTHALEQLLARLYALPGVKSTRSFVVLTTFIDRPVQAELTEAWPALPFSD